MKPRVFVVGSLHHDIVIDAPHLPRPDETVMGGPVAYICGGKGGNQAVAASRHGADVAFAGAVGTDAAADILLGNLREAGVDVAQIQRRGGASGMSVAIIEAGGDYGAVVASGANRQIDAGALMIPDNTACVVLQNEVPEAVNNAVAHAARGAIVILNAAPMRALPGDLLAAVDILILNRVEAEAFFAVPVRSAEQARAALSGAMPVPAIIITLGADGLVWRKGAEAPQAMAPFAVQVVSSHGAGDAFVGAFAAGLARGADWAEALRYASAAAAMLVSTPAERRAGIGRDVVEAMIYQSSPDRPPE